MTLDPSLTFLAVSCRYPDDSIQTNTDLEGKILPDGWQDGVVGPEKTVDEQDDETETKEQREVHEKGSIK